LTLPVGPIPEREDAVEREGRTAGLHVLAALAVGGTLAKAARDSRLPLWWLGLPLVLGVGLAGSLVGLGAARGSDVVAQRIHIGVRHAQARFWIRYFVTFLTDTVLFVLASPKLEGRALWRGASRWGWTVGWPLATLMIAANAIDVQAAERVSAARGMLLSAVTDLRNRRAFDADLAALVRDRIAFTVVFADLDGLKAVNDTHGHAAGTAAIKCLGSALARQSGVAYHWGGDEFVLLMPDTDRAAVVEAARASLSEVHDFGHARSWVLSASYGATFVAPNNSRSAEAIVASADAAMYAAKAAGRSRLVVGDESAVALY
jgi:diguanylate cyclase (GGDEF)-like protein